MTSSLPRKQRVIRPAGSSWPHTLAKLADLSHHVDLLLTLSLHRVKVRYKQSVLGITWAILQPMALMAIYTVIFSVVSRIQTNGTPYAVFVFSALLPWTFCSNAISGAANSLVAHQYLITKVYFPREILPLTYLAAAVFDFLIAAAVLAGMMAWYGIPPTWNLLWVPVILAVAVLFTIGVSLVLSALQVSFRDIGLALPLAMQLWMFASPVVYPMSSVPVRFQLWYALNPMAGVVESFRRVAVEGRPPDLTALGIGAAITLLLLPCAYISFKTREANMADAI